MKKWLGVIFSGALGILTFVFLSVSNFVSKATFGSETERNTVNAWDLLKDGTEGMDVKGYTLFKIFAIALIVVAIILVLYAVVLALKNLNVLKINFNLNLINNILLSVFAFCAIMAIVALFIMGNDMQSILGPLAEAAGVSYKVYPGFGAWANTVLGIAGCACGWALARD